MRIQESLCAALILSSFVGVLMASGWKLQPSLDEAAGTAASSDADRLHQLFDEYWEYRAREFPLSDIERGDYRYADRLTDNSPEAVDRRNQDAKAFLARASSIDRATLSEDDLVSLELFELDLENGIESHRFRTHQMALGPRSGPHQDIPQLGERVKFDTVEHYEQYLSRLSQLPQWIHNEMRHLREGLKAGFTPPKAALAGLPAQLSAIASDGLDRLSEPLSRFPKGIDEADRARVRSRYEAEIRPAIDAAFEEFRRFVVDEYLPGCTESIAAVDLPDGKAYYDFQLRQYTTTDLTAEEIHAIGLREVARLRAEMMDVIRATDFMETPQGVTASEHGDEALFAAFLHYLRTDPRFYHESAEALLAGYRDICKRMDAELPKLFGRLPRLPYGVKEIPAFMAPTQTTAYYQGGDVRNAEAGYFMANTYALDQRPKYEMQALAFHEAVPGHHFQIALAKELEGLPEFRKEAYFVAFGEGWALYSERLGLEVGFFTDPYDNFGRLLYEMWRACRLVVDPGMHALGWTREKAVKFMLDNTALSELNINNEIDRYIAWPGQACGYKIGELKITELRAKAERALGPAFDRREFHDVVLGAGAIPLDVLERRVLDWIASKIG